MWSLDGSCTSRSSTPMYRQVGFGSGASSTASSSTTSWLWAFSFSSSSFTNDDDDIDAVFTPWPLSPGSRVSLATLLRWWCSFPLPVLSSCRGRPRTAASFSLVPRRVTADASFSSFDNDDNDNDLRGRSSLTASSPSSSPSSS